MTKKRDKNDKQRTKNTKNKIERVRVRDCVKDCCHVQGSE